MIIQTGVESKSPLKQLGVYSCAQFRLNCREREKRILVVKNPPGNATRCQGARFDPWKKWQPLCYSSPENPMDRGAWRATVHGAAESQT